MADENTDPNATQMESPSPAAPTAQAIEPAVPAEQAPGAQIVPVEEAVVTVYARI